MLIVQYSANRIITSPVLFPINLLSLHISLCHQLLTPPGKLTVTYLLLTYEHLK